jgi:hypothetical protein
LEKIIKKNHIGKHCNNSQCFKEKNYKAKFLISSILKKIDKDNFRKKNKTNTKKREKNHVGNTEAIHSVL